MKIMRIDIDMKINEFKKRLTNALRMQFFRGSNLITYVEAKELLKENPQAVLLDVRSPQEYNEYHLTGAICIPTYELQTKISNIIEDKTQMIIVYCQSGGRSKKAVNILKKMGYSNLYELDGGIEEI